MKLSPVSFLFHFIQDEAAPNFYTYLSWPFHQRQCFAFRKISEVCSGCLFPSDWKFVNVEAQIWNCVKRHSFAGQRKIAIEFSKWSRNGLFDLAHPMVNWVISLDVLTSSNQISARTKSFTELGGPLWKEGAQVRGRTETNGPNRTFDHSHTKLVESEKSLLIMFSESNTMNQWFKLQTQRGAQDHRPVCVICELSLRPASCTLVRFVSSKVS